jgi:hypothetical protein
MELCLLVFVPMGLVLLAFLMDTTFGRPATRAGSAVLYPGLLRTVEGENAMLVPLSLLLESLSLSSSSSVPVDWGGTVFFSAPLSAVDCVPPRSEDDTENRETQYPRFPSSPDW